MRLFIAIPLPPQLKAQFNAIQREFRQLSVQVSWVRNSGFHLTLKFFGDIERSRIESIVSCMGKTAQGCAAFSVGIAGMGVFPHTSQPRVLWVGVQEGALHLVQLQRALETTLTQAGFAPEDRPFRPHLTLARLKHVDGRDAFEACVRRHTGDAFGRLSVTHIELLESQLLPDGARYATLAAVPLGI